VATAEQNTIRNEAELPEVTVYGDASSDSFIHHNSSVSTKTEEQNINVPQSVTVLGSDLIERVPSYNLTDAITNDSSVSPADLIFLPKIRGYNAEILKDGYTSTR